MTTPLIPMMPSMPFTFLPGAPQALPSPQYNAPYQQPSISPGSIRNCIRLRGMPYSASVEDIVSFLGDFSVYILPQGIHMVLNQQGRPSGDAFIQLSSAEKASQAGLDVSKGGCHKKHMGERYVEVFQCSGDEMNMVLMGGTLNRNGMMPPPGMAIITQEPMPPAPAPAAHPSSPLLIQTPHGTLLMQPQHQPAIHPHALDFIHPQTILSSPRTAMYPQPAYIPYTQYLPTPPISPTSPATTPQMATMPPVTPGAPNGDRVPCITVNSTGIQVRMQGMPYNAGVNDILAFFKGYSVTANSIKLLYSDKLRPTGEALITFSTLEDAHRAVVENNRKPMGNRYVELLLL